MRDSALGDHPSSIFILFFSPSYSFLVLNNKSNSLSLSPLITLIILGSIYDVKSELYN